METNPIPTESAAVEADQIRLLVQSQQQAVKHLAKIEADLARLNRFLLQFGFALILMLIGFIIVLATLVD